MDVLPISAASDSINKFYTDLFGDQSPLTGEEWVKARFNGEYPSGMPSNIPTGKGVLSMQTEVPQGQSLSKDDVVGEKIQDMSCS